MKKLSVVSLFLLALVGAYAQQPQQKKSFSVYAVGFYNQENLFDCTHDEGKNDYEFLPEGSYKWNEMKYKSKLHNMATVLSEMGTDVLPGVGCAFIGLSEVENAHCLEDLCAQPELSARGFKFCHVEGPDSRGVDCALIYNPKLFSVRDVRLVPYVTERAKDSLFVTRGFLAVSGTLAGEHVTAVVCHWPSRFSDSYYRELAGRQVRQLKDSLLRDDPQCKVMVMGDMNDDPIDRSMHKELGAKAEADDLEEGDMYNPWYNILVKKNTGTLRYQGAWNLFDQIVMTPNMVNPKGSRDFSTLKFWKPEIFRRDYLFQTEGLYKGGTKRTTAGGVWLNGYSDHLPVVVYLVKERR